MAAGRGKSDAAMLPWRAAKSGPDQRDPVHLHCSSEAVMAGGTRPQLSPRRRYTGVSSMGSSQPASMWPI